MGDIMIGNKKLIQLRNECVNEIKAIFKLTDDQLRERLKQWFPSLHMGGVEREEMLLMACKAAVHDRIDKEIK
jgi:hypothetical protein